MIKRITLWALNWLVSNADFKAWTSDVPFGRKLGGHNIAGVRDKFLILEITIAGSRLWIAHWQQS